MTKTFKGRPVLPGKVEDTAEVSHYGFSTSAVYIEVVFKDSSSGVCKDGDNKELFDMIKDPNETINIAGDNPDIIKKMEELYSAGWEKAIPENPIVEPIRCK